MKVIEELLGYARLREPVRRNVRVDDAVGEIVERFAARPGLAVGVDLCSGAHMPIDEELIRLALDNVLRNAEQALDARESGRIEVRTRPSGPGAQIAIVDDGPGIDPMARDRVFEPLFSTRSFGVGLGLPVARHILEQHGGTLEITASGPAGTTVTLWLPGHSRLDGPARRR